MGHFKKLTSFVLALGLLAGLSAPVAAQTGPQRSPEASVIYLDDYEIKGFPGEEYTLGFQLRYGEELYENLIWGSAHPNIAQVSADGVVTLLSPGTTQVSVTTENGLYDSCKITVRGVSELVEGQIQTLPLDADTQYFSFIPQKNGWYGFFTSGGLGVDTRAWLYDSNGELLEEAWDGAYMEHFLLRYELTAGQRYELRVQCDNPEQGGTYQLQVRPLENAVSLVLSSQSISCKINDRPELSAMLIPFNSFEQEITWSSSDESVVSFDEWHGLGVRGIGTATVTATTEGGLTASCEITVEDYPVLACGSSMTVDPTRGHSMHRFVPQEDGWYGFYTTGGKNSDPVGILWDADFREITREDYGAEDGHFVLTRQLTAGQTYYIETYCWDFANEEPYELRVDKAGTATSMTLSYEGITGNRNTSEYRMVAQFYPLPSVPQKVTWTSSDETVVTLSYANYLWLREPGTATVTATAESGLTAVCNVTVEEYPIIQSGEPVLVEGNGEKRTFAFFPETDGYYCFYCTGADDELCIEGSISSDQWVLTEDRFSSNFWVCWNMQVGQVYYLESEVFRPDGQYRYTVQVVPMIQATGIDLDREYLAGYQGEEYYLDCRMEPINAFEEELTWTSSDETVAIAMTDTVLFRFPGSCVLTATSESGLTVTIPVTVRQIPEIFCGDTVQAEAGDGQTKLRFTPETDGEYVFSSRGATGCEVYLFDSVEMVAQFDSEERGDFRMTCSLQAGMTYELTCSPKDADAQGTYQISLAKNEEGITVSGTVQSAGEDPVTVELLTADGQVAQVLTTADGTYCFENVLPGSYTLRISASNHVAREYAVTAGEDPVELELQTCPLGDVTGDGSVNMGDTARLYAIIRGVSAISDEYRLACANVNGGKLNMGDLAGIYAHVRGTKKLY